jgi:hypothetical protein
MTKFLFHGLTDIPGLPIAYLLISLISPGV